jgi:glycosyltransferase involved in cell wall biosynthesis
MSSRHVVLLHPVLEFSGETERMLAIARVLRARGTRTSVLTRPGSRSFACERAAQQHGFTLRLAELPHEPASEPFAFLRTRRALADLEPDLVHVVSSRLATLAAGLCATLDVPYVLELDHEPFGRIPRATRRLLCVAITSPTLAAAAVNVGRIPRNLLLVARHAPEDPLPPATSGRGPARIGCAGLLEAAHGTETFVEAVRLLGQLPRPCHFAILGEGPREALWRRRVRELGLADRITIGPPTTEDAASTLSALDVFVSTRTSGGPDWLGVLALRLGVPSVLCATGDAFALVEDQVSGLLFERGNARQLADALERLAANPAQARALGARARTRLAALLPPGTFAAELEALHARALELAGV